MWITDVTYILHIYEILLVSFCRFEGQCHFSGSKLLIWHINLSLRLWDLRKQWVLLSSLLFMGLIYCSLYVPYILISYCNEHCLQPRVAERHFLDLRKRYGSVLAVDLVNAVHILLFLEPSAFSITCLIFIMKAMCTW